MRYDKILVFAIAIFSIAPSISHARNRNTAYLQLLANEQAAADAEAERQRLYLLSIPNLVKAQTGNAVGSCAIQFGYSILGLNVSIYDAPISACDCAIINQGLGGPQDAAGFRTALQTDKLNSYAIVSDGGVVYGLRDESSLQYLEILRSIYLAGVKAPSYYGTVNLNVAEAVNPYTGVQENSRAGVVYPLIHQMCGTMPTVNTQTAQVTAPTTATTTTTTTATQTTTATPTYVAPAVEIDYSLLLNFFGYW